MRSITPSQKVLLTGATGFLGSHLVRALLAEKYELIILKRSFSDISRIEGVINEADVYDIDRCPLEQPFKEHKKIDFVIHTATIYGRNQEKITKIFETNLSFPLKLLETATFFNTDTFFNADTILYEHLNAYTLTKKHFADWGKQFALMKKIQFVNIKLCCASMEVGQPASTKMLHPCPK
jgi:nucleoside-diphosphate-sugar epimerase